MHHLDDDTQRMIDSLPGIERALVDLERGLEQYAASYGAIARATYSNANNEHVRLDLRISTARLYALLARRVRGLGLQGLLAAADTPGAARETWVVEFADEIRRQLDREPA